MYYIRTTQFAESNFGSKLLYSLLVLRDVVPVVILIPLNVILIYLFKRYLMQKSKLIKIRDVDNDNTTNIQVRSKNDPITTRHISQSVDVAANTNGLIISPNTITKQNSNRAIQNNPKIRIDKAERSATLMAIFLTITSILKHSLVILANVLFIMSEYVIGYYVGSLQNLTFSIIYSFDFLIFYLFNTNFRNAIKKTFHFGTYRS
jgi:hypothetical protein